nr:RNA-directed DNA polymerase, eukaryota, reverse transcriptase zinc-binding domain protein [Tanacetum cinerariifolium]GFA09615.1 RNA-directed DNA polymerase, eukaryota, reverse transcriptase zinc-binding domain protein [Tanacetum cinerariifolium]
MVEKVPSFKTRGRLGPRSYNSWMNLLLAGMRNLDQKIDEGLASDEDKSSRISKLQELDYFEKMNSLDLMQKARVKWKVKGDENSKFFHGLINSWRKSKSIHEIKTTVWDCGSNKAPGPGGYSFLFIERFWDLLKHDIHEFVVSFFSSGKFPQGRQILDGPLILSEIIDWYKKRKKKLLLFKVDFEKAFDSILIDRFKARLSGWKANLLFISGRLTLIKSVLGSLGCWIMVVG